MFWSYWTTPKEAMGKMPFNLVYNIEVIAPIEIGLESAQVKAYDEGSVER